jgi:hypothetical protein
MINYGRLILKAWFEMLDGVVSKPVYRTDADSAETGHYFLIRIESNTTRNTNSSFVNNPVVIIEAITRFENKIDDAVACDMMIEVDQLIFPDPSRNGLPVQTGMQVVKVTKQTETVLAEDNGSFPKINRIVARYLHTVLQT